jgi:hypothetical protein
MTDKEKYRILCEKEPISIFSQAWWFDAASGEETWDVILVEKNDEIMAAFPFLFHKNRSIIMPKVSENIHLWIRYPEKQKYLKRIGMEKDLITEIIDKLPKYATFDVNFHHSLKNWLPFYWKGFNAVPRYTYVIDDLENEEIIYSNFEDSIRGHLKKAQKTVKVTEDYDIKRFYEIYEMTFARQKLKADISFEEIESMDNECTKRNCRKKYFAVDDSGRIHAAAYFVWDKEVMYYILAGGNPELRNSNAASLLLWEAIKFSKTVTKKFDFGGSMIEPIERFFRGFGAVQEVYFNVKKINSKMFKIKNFLREIK